MSKKRKIHFVGIGDPVMLDLAIAMKGAGHEVSASEATIDSQVSDRLAGTGLIPSPGWSPDGIRKELDAIVISPAITKENPELRQAMELKIPVTSCSEFIYGECKNKHRVVVTGSSSKSMITLLIVHVLQYHKRRFDYVVARHVPDMKHSIRLSDAPLVIIEGQEGVASTLDATTIFLKYRHHIGLISGIEWQESPTYPSKADYTRQFSLFESSTPKGGVLIYFELEPVVTALSKTNLPDVLYIPYKTHLSTYEGGQEFLLGSGNDKHPLKLTGKHNLQSISGAKETLKKLGITSAMFYNAIQTFGGNTI